MSQERGTSAAEPDASEPTEALAAVVARLRAELAGVRTAMRNRAVIEQAKGVLVERLGVSPDESFDHLVRLSQRTNIKLVEVAAAIVGTTAPDPRGSPVSEVVDLVDDEMRQHLARTRGRSASTPPPPRTDPARRALRAGRGSRPAELPSEAAATADSPATTPGTAGRSATTPGTAGRSTPVRPGAAGAIGGARVRPPQVEALQAQHQLLNARISAATSCDEVAEAIGTAECWPEPSVIILTLLEPDGAQRLVGAARLSPQARSQWQRIPPHLPVPVAAAVRDAQSFLLPNRPAVITAFPGISAMPYTGAALYTAPLIANGRVTGALGLAWIDQLADGEQLRPYFDALAESAARKVVELTSDTDTPGNSTLTADQLWLPVVLEALPQPAMVLGPVRAGNRVVDFDIGYANAGARAGFAEDRIEAERPTLLTVYPELGSQLLLAEFSRILADGEPVQLPALRVDATADGVPRSYLMTVTAARVWDRILMITRRHTDADALYDQMLQAERIGRIGSFCWDLHTSEPLCSPQLYRLFYGDQPAGPIPVDELAACVHADDLLGVQDAVRRSLIHGKQLSAEFRGAGRLAGRRLRVTAEPLTGDDGAVTAIRGTVQDVTEERSMESRLRLAEEALAAQRRRHEAETRAAQALQQALLPTEPELGTTYGLSVRGRCRASEHTGRVNGDWWDAYPLPDRSTVLVVGDVAGSGLTAMTAAARLRYAVRAYAALGLAPAEVATAVNSMLCSLEPERTATLVVARYTPKRHELRWATAGGGGPMILTPDGTARVLNGPLGLPAGAVANSRYTDTAVVLAPGDRVLLYSDSDVGRHEAAVAAEVGSRATDDLGALVGQVMRAVHPGTAEDMCAALVSVHR
jgi:PAS domain-containing protein